MEESSKWCWEYNCLKLVRPAGGKDIPFYCLLPSTFLQTTSEMVHDLKGVCQ
jgi:hypothetical protein